MFRFFVENKEDNYFVLSGDVIKHLKVARVNNEFICIYNGEFYITKQEGSRAVIISKINENHEHDGEVIVAAGIMNIKRFEWLIQKAAELGATRVIPFVSKNTSIKINDNLGKKKQRWNQIAINASEQAFRNKPMIVGDIISFTDVLSIDIKNKYIAYENAKGKDKFYESNSMFITGPEGGFTREEVELAKTNGVEVVSLGGRILRAETAPLFMLSRIIK